jgi:hypothetical protein
MKLATALFAGLLLVAACGGTSYEIPSQDPTLLAQPQPAAEVRGAVVSALVQRKFAAEGEEVGKITAHHSKGGMEMKIVVEYDESHYRVMLLGFGGYKSQPGPNGTQVPEERLSKELLALKKSIDLELKRPAKERAEAERQEREYQLLLEQQRTAQAQAQAQAAQAQQQQQAQPAGPAVVVPVTLPGVPLPTINASSSTSVTSGSQKITCCINGALYNCPSQDAYRQCMTMNPSACSSAGRCN